MKALTERDLREELGWKQVESYTIEPGTLVTPSARQFLNERKIELIVKGKQGAEHGPGPDSKPMAEDPAGGGRRSRPHSSRASSARTAGCSPSSRNT